MRRGSVYEPDHSEDDGSVRRTAPAYQQRRASVAFARRSQSDLRRLKNGGDDGDVDEGSSLPSTGTPSSMRLRGSEESQVNEMVSAGVERTAADLRRAVKTKDGGKVRTSALATQRLTANSQMANVRAAVDEDIVGLLVGGIKEFKTDPDVHVPCMAALMNVFVAKEFRKHLDEGGMEVVLQVLRHAKRGDEESVEQCARVLHAVCLGNQENQSFLASKGCAILVTALGRLASEDESLQRCLYSVLSPLSNHEIGREAMLDAKVLTEIEKTLKKFPKDGALVKDCCTVAFNLTYDEEAVVEFVRAGGVKALMTCMSRLGPDEVGLGSVVQVLNNLLMVESMIKRIGKDGEVVRAVLKVLGATKRAETAQNCAQVLAVYLGPEEDQAPAGDVDYFEMVSNEEDLQCFLNAMENHVTSVEVQTAIGEILAPLASDQTCSEILLDLGVVAAAVKTGRAHLKEPDVLKLCCEIVSNISQEEDFFTTLKEDGGVDFVLEAMKALMDEPDALEVCCYAIGNVAKLELSVVKKGLPLVFEAANKHDKSGLQLAALQAMQRMAYVAENRWELLRTKEGVNTLTRAWRLLAADKGANDVCSRALLSIAVAGDEGRSLVMSHPDTPPATVGSLQRQVKKMSAQPPAGDAKLPTSILNACKLIGTLCSDVGQGGSAMRKIFTETGQSGQWRRE